MRAGWHALSLRRAWGHFKVRTPFARPQGVPPTVWTRRPTTVGSLQKNIRKRAVPGGARDPTPLPEGSILNQSNDKQHIYVKQVGNDADRAPYRCVKRKPTAMNQKRSSQIMNPELGQLLVSPLKIARLSRWDAVATTTTLFIIRPRLNFCQGGSGKKMALVQIQLKLACGLAR